MENIVADFTISNENTINAEYSIEQDNFDCSFEIFASGTVWGAITGNITDQTDLINILNEKATISYVDTNIQSEATSRAESDTLLQNNINTLSDNLTSEINARTLADDNLQTQIDDINTAGYITKDVNDLSYYMLTTDINTALSGKQNTISDLADIRNNAENGNTAYNTIQNYGDIVTYNADNFATASQGALADTSIQPNDNITLLNNNAGFITIDALNGYATEDFVTSQGYITGIDNTDVVNALGYTPYDSSNPAGYITSASLPTVNNSTITIQKNGETVESFTLNQANNKTINITVPTQASDVGALPSSTTINDLTSTAQQNALNSGATSTNIGQIATNTTAISTETLNRQNADNDLQSQIDAIVSSSDVYDIVGTYAELQAYDISTVPVNDIIKVLVDSTHNNSATYYRCVETNNVKSWSYIGSEGAYYTKSEADGRFVTNTSLTTILSDYVLSSDLSTTLANYVTSANLTTILDDYATKQWVNNQEYITSADLPTNYLTTDTAQDISGRKTFLGEKAIYFKQVTTSNKLGFTLYNPSNTELGALEYRPSTIGSASLLAINCPQTTGGYVGFRYWGTPAVNIVAPKVATAGNYYIPTHITNGSTTVTATNQGTVDISTLLPDVSKKQDTLVSGTNIKTINNTSLLGSGNISVLKNTATGSNSITILGTATNKTEATNIGYGSTALRNYATALGYGSTASNYATALGSGAEASIDFATALGYHATASGKYAIQIGYGTNSTANTLNIGFYNDITTHYNWQLLDGTTGLIPDARISTNIARTSQIPDVSNFVTNSSLATTLADYALSSDIPTKTSDLTNDSNFATVSQIPTNNNQLTNGAGYITGITSSDVTTALGYTPSDTDLSNLSATGQAVIDAKVNNDDYYYKSGDTITNLGYSTGGLLTNGGQEISFCIWLPKSMAKITTVTCTALLTGFRKSNGGYMPSNGNGWNALANGRVTLFKYSDNMLRVQVNYGSYGGTNNTPVGVWASISLSFT